MAKSGNEAGIPERATGNTPGLSPSTFWPLAFLVLFLQRLPILLSPNRILDGDEAILGLMALRISEGVEFPLFFWGQSYGLSIVEALPAGLAFRVFGPTSLTLSLAMFVLFLAGLALWEGAFRRMAGHRGWAQFLVLILGLLPVWAIWSLKARGGYLTAFLLSGLIARWVSGSGFDRGKALLVGTVAAVLFFAQPVWFLPILPLLILPVLNRGEASESRPGPILGSMAAGFLVGFLPFVLVASTRRAFWRPDLIGFEFWGNLFSSPSTLLDAITGAFYLESRLPTPWPVAVVGFVVAVAIPVTLGLLAWRGAKEKNGTAAVLALSLLFALAGLGFLQSLPPRYFLQVSPFLLLGGAYLFPRFSTRRVEGLPTAVSVVLVLAAVGSMAWAYRPVAPDSAGGIEPAMADLVEALEGEGMEAAYSMDALLQWQFMFYGQERIPARFASPVDRRPDLARAVDQALAEGRPVALIGMMSQARPIMGTPLGDRIRPIGGIFFYIADVQWPLLESLGFRFNPE